MPQVSIPTKDPTGGQPPMGPGAPQAAPGGASPQRPTPGPQGAGGGGSQANPAALAELAQVLTPDRFKLLMQLFGASMADAYSKLQQTARGAMSPAGPGGGPMSPQGGPPQGPPKPGMPPGPGM